MIFSIWMQSRLNSGCRSAKAASGQEVFRHMYVHTILCRQVHCKHLQAALPSLHCCKSIGICKQQISVLQAITVLLLVHNAAAATPQGAPALVSPSKTKFRCQSSGIHNKGKILHGFCCLLSRESSVAGFLQLSVAYTHRPRLIIW